MKMVRITGLVLHGYYRMRAFPRYSPRLSDFGHCLGFDDIFAASELLARHGLLDWKTIRGVAGAAFGSGRITELGIKVVEGHVSAPCAMLLPHHDATPLRCGSMPDISRQLDEISFALEHCEADQEDIAEVRRRLRRLTEHPLVAAMGRLGA